MRKLIIALAMLMSLAPVRSAEAKLRVVTTIETFADLARKIGGDRVEVQALSHGYMDPHFVEAKPSLILTLNRADLLVYVGLDLEIGWLPPLVLGSRNERIQLGATGNLDASSKIPVLDIPTAKIDRSMGDIHPQGNPHYWLPPDNALIIAHEIADRLKALDGANASFFDGNLRSFEAEVARRRSIWEVQAAALRGLKVVTYHKSWTYLSRWLGLAEVGYVEPKPGIPPAPSHIAQIIGFMRQEHVKAVMVESFYPRNTAGLVADKAGARLLILPNDVGAQPNIRDYFALVDSIVQKLLEATH